MDHRLKKDKQFSYVYKKGKKFHTEHLTLFSVESKFRNYLIGYAISKKVGKANKRNKLKRRLKEIIRKSELPKNFHNYVLMAKVGATEINFQDLKSQVEKLFFKASEKWNMFYFHSKWYFML